MKTTTHQNRRRIRLVDHFLQTSLLLALVVMETVGVALALWILYNNLGAIVDQNTYRIHFSGDASILALLLREGLRVLGAMLLLNLLALIIADRIWAFFVRGILRHLGNLMRASGQLDFTQQEPIFFHHAVLEEASNWRQSEMQRLAGLRDGIRGLPSLLPGTEQEKMAVAAALKKIQDA